MPLAAPLILPFAELAGITIAGLGMAAASKKVSDFISDNPETSTQILTMLVPGGQGLNALFKKKASVTLEDVEDMTDEEAADLSKEDKAEIMKEMGKSKGGDKRQRMIEISEKLGLSGEGKEKQTIIDEVEERYDEGGVEDAPKPKFDYKKFFRNRNADGGAIGIEVLFEEKKDGGRIGFANGGIENIIGADLKDPDTEMNQMIQSPSNLFSVATGSGLHEQAMRDYLNPFSRNKNIQVGKGAVGDYMSNYLKDYIDPNNQAGGKFGERRGPNQMQVTGLGESPNPFSRTGIATAARLAEDPSFQAENLFGEGTLTQVPGGYDYTGGKFDFNFAGPLEEMIFGPSTYGMKFDKDMNPLDQFSRDFRAFDQAKMGNLSSGNNVRGDAISRTNVQGRDLEADLGTRINPNIQPSLNMFQRAGNFIGA